ncbi:carbon-nitrogen hydrolase family protein [bacterium]|nr:carbon-nitrogen hydrolase family protein [bacterium]MDA7645149.1 carbon-nitrogen hydrolase family protein [bacterium]MDB4745596.1 carbon-nitrogen hydrolase family protein [Verrucomicrobiota bacterium]
MATMIAAAQMDVQLGEVSSNLQRIIARMETAVEHGASLVIFPECAVTGYCFDHFEQAKLFGESIPGKSTEMIAAACARLQCCAVIGMLESGERGELYNAAVLLGPSGVISSYRKAHLPFLGVDRFTTPGDGAFQVSAAGEIRVGMNICYDATFPEAARVLMLEGADLIVLPTNWPPGSKAAAEYVINARALENKVYYAAVNRVGIENGFEFIGCSRICGPNGQTLVEAPHRDEAILYAEIDVQLAREKHIVRVAQKHEIHRVRDRRPDLYCKVTERLSAERFRGGEIIDN